jgi:Concanavalin A-like lectin/glucanases superfamily
VTISSLVLVAVLVLPVVMLLAFAGCTGEDPVLAAQKAREEEQKKQADERAVAQKAKEYDVVIGNTPGIVSYWRLNEPSTGGTQAKDSAPDDPKHGEYRNLQGVSLGQTGVLSPAKEGNDKAAEFDGLQGLVEVPFDSLLNPPLDFSVEAWVRPATGATGAQVVLSSYEVDETGAMKRGFALEVVGGAAPKARARVGSGTGFASVEADLGSGSEHDRWRHLVITYSGGAKALKLYVNADDGKADAELPSLADATPVTYAVNRGRPLRIAAGQVEVPVPKDVPGLLFDGRIDEVALYRVALDGTTIRNHFLSALTP